MSETARALGMPGHIEWRGERLVVSRVTFEVEALFEVWLENNLTAALERSRETSRPDLYRDRLREGNAQLAAREFCWDSDAARRATFTPAGFRELSYLCLARERVGWTREQHAALCADKAKFAELVRVIHQVSDPLPNGPGPAPPAREEARAGT
jgi:hypothetical protein